MSPVKMSQTFACLRLGRRPTRWIAAQRTRIGAALNSDVLVLGSYLTIGAADHGQVRLDVRMQDGKTGEILTEVAEVGSTQDLFRLVSHSGRQVARSPGGPGVAELPSEAGVLASLPLDPEAARFYALGVAKLREFDALAAKDLLRAGCPGRPEVFAGTQHAGAGMGRTRV